MFLLILAFVKFSVTVECQCYCVISQSSQLYVFHIKLCFDFLFAERQIDNGEKLKSVLLQWGSDLDDVTFMLKRKCTSSRLSHSQVLYCMFSHSAMLLAFTLCVFCSFKEMFL